MSDIHKYIKLNKFKHMDVIHRKECLQNIENGVICVIYVCIFVEYEFKGNASVRDFCIVIVLC